MKYIHLSPREQNIKLLVHKSVRKILLRMQGEVKQHSMSKELEDEAMTIDALVDNYFYEDQ